MSVRFHDYTGELKYLAPSKAIVTDNKDPLNKGRVRVYSPVFGYTPWIFCITSEDGFFAPPDIDTIVYIEADGGDPNYLFIRGIVNDGDDLDPDTPQSFRREVPTNRGWVSPGFLDATGKVITPNSGHIIELDDGIALNSDGTIAHTSESKGIRLTTSGGHYLHLWEEEAEGSSKNRVELGTSQSQILQLIDDSDPTKQQIVLKDAEERTIEIIKESDRIRIRNRAGSIFIDVDFANDIVEIDANNVKVGTSADQSIVRGDAMKSKYDAHVHICPACGGQTSVPVSPIDSPGGGDGVLSDLHKVE